MSVSMVSDASKLLRLDELEIFKSAKRRASGDRVCHEDTEAAIRDLADFQRTGHVPSYVENFCLDHLRTTKPRQKARRLTAPLRGGIDHHSSLVGALSDQEDGA